MSETTHLTKPCPLCKQNNCKLIRQDSFSDMNSYDCENCGKYFITGSAESNLTSLSENALAILSASTWQRQIETDHPPIIFEEHLGAAQKELLPDPAEQLNRFILFLGENQKSPGERLPVKQGCLRAKLGIVNVADEFFIIESALSLSLIGTTSSATGTPLIRLTLEGWQEFHKIKRGVIKSHTAFMAMPFGIDAVTRIVDETFIPAIKETGFNLRTVNAKPAAGSIDDRMRVEIRMSRFLVADLTCENRGAYWEAGYAEGLGKPVIYTCNKFYFEKEGTHFDTNHHQTVLWEPERPEEAAEKLKDTIRATLPFEAKMPESEL